MPSRPTFVARLKAWSTATSTGAVVAQNAAVALVYVVLSELVLLPRFVGGDRATPVWPADGLVLVAVWWLGWRVLPGVALGAALVIGARSPLPMALISALAPVAEVLVTVRVLRTVHFDDRLERLRDPLLLTLVAAPAGAAVSAGIGATAAWAFGAVGTTQLPFAWLLWLMRDWLGIAIFAPLAFAWLRSRPLPSTPAQMLEAGALVVSLLAATQVAFGVWALGPPADLPLAFLALGFVTWAGLRFGARGAAAVVALVTVLAIAAAVFGLAPVGDLPVESAHVVTFMFLLLAAVLGQVVAAIKAERDDARSKRVQLEEQLRHAQKMEAIGRLAGGIAHDFNNLLTAIIGYADIVLTTLDAKDPRRPDVEQIARAAQRAAELTRQMLAFSRRRTDQPKHADLNVVVSKVEPMLRRVLGEDVKLMMGTRATEPVVPLDAGHLEQVIMNLAVNARDAMPKGGRLTIETTDETVLEDDIEAVPDARAGEFVTLTVSDTGSGMSPQVRAHIFEPYFTTKEAGKGTGLGLSTVYGIVRQSEGYVTVASEPGLGTTFRVFLPRAAGEAAADADTGPQSLPGGTEYILLVEDDASVRRMARDLLIRLGYSVTEASSGRAGIALGGDDTRHFDLLLADVILGDVSGTAVAEAVTALRPSMRVLFMSGYADDALVRTGVLEDGRPLLQKPFTPVQLARKIREVLEDRETDAA